MRSRRLSDLSNLTELAFCTALPSAMPCQNHNMEAIGIAAIYFDRAEDRLGHGGRQPMPNTARMIPLENERRGPITADRR
jgi:hypothetical protein